MDSEEVLTENGSLEEDIVVEEEVLSTSPAPPDLVWAKMRGFAPWPAKIIDPPPPEIKVPNKQKKPLICVLFFGTRNYGWIEEPNIQPYREYKARNLPNCKSKPAKEAVQRIEEYIQDPIKHKAHAEHEALAKQSENDAAFNKLRQKDNSDAETEQSSSVSTKNSQGSSRKRPITISSKSTSLKFRMSNDKVREKPKGKSKLLKDNMSEPVDAADEHGTTSRPMGDEYNHHADVSNTSYSSRRDGASAHLLNRPEVQARPEPVEIDMRNMSSTLRQKNIDPSKLKFGFLGLGIMGSGIVKNLIGSGHHVCVWNRTQAKCRKFAQAGANMCGTPADVVQQSDVIFSCVSDPQAAKDMVFGNCGVLSEEFIGSKGYVEMTGIDGETSQDISDAIIARGGRYLEAQIQGTKAQSEEGTLIVLAAGDRSLFDECQTCFEAMGRNSFYLGEVGNATKMNLVMQMLSGVSLAILCEALALADRAGLQLKDVMEVMELTNVASPLLLDKGRAIVEGKHPTAHPLRHMQKDLKLVLSLSDMLEQPVPITSTSNEVYKHAKRIGFGDHDTSSMYIRTKF